MGACSWVPSYAQCSNTDAIDAMNDEDRASVEQMATDLLWAWTGKVFGPCPVEYRPCRQGRSKVGFAERGWVLASQEWSPTWAGDRWWSVSCGTCGDSCGCSGTTALRLPWPVHSIDEIVVDGVVLDPSAYRLDHHSLLQRTDGLRWPSQQDLSLPPTEPNTWQVRYLWGVDVPEGGKVAAGILAAEFAMAICNDNHCQLPRRIQSITRQGVTVTLLDQFEDIAKGRTGIWLVDAWVASVMAPARPSTVISPDVPRKRLQFPVVGGV